MSEIEKVKLTAILETLNNVSYTALQTAEELKVPVDKKKLELLNQNQQVLESLIQDLFAG